MSNNSGNPELNQLVSFIQHDIPGLEDGRYKLEVTQEITDKGSVVSDDTLTVTYTFGVSGDRFSLSKPTEMVYSVFPADQASGKYSTVLPSVVFTKTTFPWSRIPTNSLNDYYQGEKPLVGQDTEADVPTWLTILILDEDDVAAYAKEFPAFQLQPTNATIGDLFLQSANPNSSLGTNYSYFNGVTTDQDPLSKYMDPGDLITDAIQVLDIPMPLFVRIAPTVKDLSLMAHVRKVSLIQKPTMAGISDVGEPEGSFAIVFGNRLPNTLKKTFAFLVSLEQLENYLPSTEDGGNTTMPNADMTKYLRLAVLRNWSFYSTGDNATFVDQLKALNHAEASALPQNSDALTSVDDTTVQVNSNLSVNTNLRLTVGDDALPIVKNALSMGYVPLNHQLRTGENNGGITALDKTVSWYRGPLAPYEINKAAIRLPVSSPDKVTIFDPTTGMLDASYAAAWTLGRQLALQDPNFSTTLYTWKRGLSRQVVNNVEQSLLSANFNTLLAAARRRSPAARSASGAEEATEPIAGQKTKRGELARQLILSLSKPQQ